MTRFIELQEFEFAMESYRQGVRRGRFVIFEVADEIAALFRAAARRDQLKSRIRRQMSTILMEFDSGLDLSKYLEPNEITRLLNRLDMPREDEKEILDRHRTEDWALSRTTRNEEE